jgi:hypothetical protein
MTPLMAIWDDLVAPSILSLVAGAVASVWPWLQSYWRGRRFQALIRRELEEVAPYVGDDRDPARRWSDHLAKRFVHQRIFDHDDITTNRDFLLSLDPEVVYNVSQLWTAYREGDATQWLHFLKKLAHNPRVGSPRLRRAYRSWSKLIEDDNRDARSRPRPDDEAGEEPVGL